MRAIIDLRPFTIKFLVCNKFFWNWFLDIRRYSRKDAAMSLPSLAKNMAGEVKRSMDHSFPTTLWEKWGTTPLRLLEPSQLSAALFSTPTPIPETAKLVKGWWVKLLAKQRCSVSRRLDAQLRRGGVWSVTVLGMTLSPATLQTSCVTLGKSLNLSQPVSLSLNR